MLPSSTSQWWRGAAAVPLLPFTGRRRRWFSQSTSIPKKLQRVRDHAFDNYMDVEKKLRHFLGLYHIMAAHPSASLPVSRLDSIARRFLSLPSLAAGRSLLAHPHAFHVFDHPVQRVLWARPTPAALAVLRLESAAVAADLPAAADRLHRLLLLSTASGRRIPLNAIRLASAELALPPDFPHSLLLPDPGRFRLAPDHFVELAQPPPPSPPAAAIDAAREHEYRSRSLKSEEDHRFSFIINFPPGFKIGKFYRIAVWKWQRLPYWSPYEDVSGYDLRSIEARKRMEKRAVAVIHELLSLTVEKRMTLERIAQFRDAMGLPKKLKEFLLQHQGIFYISTRGNQGKLHTVFLREAYRKGELLEPNDVYLARRKLGDLLLMSPRNVNQDRMMTSLGRGEGLGGRRTSDRGFLGVEEYGQGKEGESEHDSGVETEFFD